jgi:hypothetical protein
MRNFLNQKKQNDFEIGSFEDHRISWNPAPASPGDTVQINYHGLLKDSGADSVFMHFSFDSWSSPAHTVRMDREGDKFTTEVKANGNHELDFCFKDSAANWDNNNGANWLIHLQ